MTSYALALNEKAFHGLLTQYIMGSNMTSQRVSMTSQIVNKTITNTNMLRLPNPYMLRLPNTNMLRLPNTLTC